MIHVPPTVRRLPALDGIRGVLVIFLLCFHFGVTQLQGAWLTLNVFFVLSGFLIVRLLVQERARTGRIRFLAFYARRARRLFPALALLLATVVGYGFVFASDQARGPLRWDVLATMGYFMNWRLIAQSNQYFVQFAEPSVLQHAWSLSVEEQFYLVIPALILLLMAVLRTRRALIATLVGLALVSAGWMAVVGVGSDFARSHLYYGTDTRAQSLLIGAALGVWTARFDAAERPNPLSVKHVQLVGWVAFALTVAGFVLAVPQTRLMADGGMFALSLAAVAWVWAVSDERTGPLQRVLAVPPLAALGRISYGAYLWHWPIGLWLGQLMPDSGTWLRVVLGFVLTIGVATISYQRIELPIHDRGWRSVVGGALRARTLAVAIVLALVACSVGLVGGPARGVGAAGEAGSPPGQAVTTPVPDLVAGQRSYRAPANGRQVVAVFGDSVPNRLGADFPASRFPDFEVVNAAVAGCDLLSSEYVNPGNGDAEALRGDCVAQQRDWPKPLVNSGTQLLLIFPSRLLVFPHRIDGKDRTWGDPVYTEQIESQLTKVADGAKETGARVAVVTMPCYDPVTAAGVFLDTMREDDPAGLKELADPVHLNGVVRAWARGHDAAVIDLNAAVCKAHQRPGRLHGKSLYADGIHFSPWGAAVVWKWLVPQAQRVLQGRS